MSEINIIIPAAGKSQRFKNEGFDLPKPFLRLKDLKGKEEMMLTRVLRSIPTPWLGDVFIGVPSSQLKNIEPVHTYDHFIGIEETTGQLDTILQIIDREFTGEHRENPVLILDVDIILEQSDIYHFCRACAPYVQGVMVTKTFDPNASRIDSFPFPKRFVEKEPISAWGIVSGRYFRDVNTLEFAGKSILKAFGESYLTHAMNLIPGVTSRYAYEIFRYVDLGTPERVREAGWEIL